MLKFDKVPVLDRSSFESYMYVVINDWMHFGKGFSQGEKGENVEILSK